jgi:general secretion pathway protein E
MSLVQDLAQMALPIEGGDPTPYEQALTEAASQQRSLVGTLIEEGLVDETRFLMALSTWLDVLWWDEPVMMPPQLRDKFPARLALRYHLLPIREDEHGLWILTYDPFNLLAKQAVHQSVSQKIVWALCTRKQILEGLRQGFGIGAETFEQILEGREIDEDAIDLKQETNVLDQDDSDASVIKFVNQILREALQERATDIHVEPLEDDLRIRYRIDGQLHEVPVPSQIKILQAAVISRLKIMAHLDIAERRLPQDGRINLELEGQPIDVRVATIPSVTGESVSLRLLGQERFDFARLGLDQEAEAQIRSLLSMPNGIMLITGPTGSGKSTSMYTFLSALNTKERRIVTIEDPVEHVLPGVIQIAVKPEIQLTFATGLRSILRGDPNVIMVGEMRDVETAEIAIRAALTGHLVFSTLHTNDAIGGITRLVDMGIEPFLVASSVRAFIAQRLVRTLCPHCKGPAKLSDDYLRQIGFVRMVSGLSAISRKDLDNIMTANGCEKCRYSGYTGRMAIFEIVQITPKMQDHITQRKPATLLKSIAMEDGMVPLRQYGWLKVLEGRTTVEEIIRVTTADVKVLDE